MLKIQQEKFTVDLDFLMSQLYIRSHCFRLCPCIHTLSVIGDFFAAAFCILINLFSPVIELRHIRRFSLCTRIQFNFLVEQHMPPLSIHDRIKIYSTPSVFRYRRFLISRPDVHVWFNLFNCIGLCFERGFSFNGQIVSGFRIN